MQTIIPIPMPAYTDGPSGPWTNSDTQFIAVLSLTLFIAWAITLLANWLYYRAKGRPEKLITLMEPWNVKTGCSPIFLSVFFYSMLVLDVLGGMGYLIYQIIF